MNRITSKVSLCFLAWITLLALPILAQTGAITGTVVDAQGSVIVGATVKAVDQQKGALMRETVTGGDGLFMLHPLQPGTYTVRVSAKGMKDLARPDINLDQYQVLGLGQLTMNVGAATETVTVEATTPLVETATADHSAVIDSRQVTEISMNGRDFQSLIRTLPGVVSNDASDFRLAFNNTDSFHVDGLRGSNNNVYLDGAVNTDVGANDGQFTQLSMDAVGEFKLQTSNFSAEYGRNPGVRIAIDTKSGTQNFHGTVYEFNRENGFDANQLFNKIQPNGIAQTPVPNSELRFNQYGFNVGGPIPLWKASHYRSPKMFFFFNFEGTKALRPNGGTTYSMPNPALLGIGTPNGAADFSSLLKTDDMCADSLPAGGTCPSGQGPIGYKVGTVFEPGTITYNSAQQITGGTPFLGNVIPSSMFSSQMPAWVNYLKPFYKTGAYQDPNNPANFIIPWQDTYTFDKHQEVVRYDWNINAKTNFFFRWVDDSQREAQGFGIFAGNTFPGVPGYRKKPGSSWSWNLMSQVSPTITNEFIFGYNHLTQVLGLNQAQPLTDKTKLGFTYGDLFPNANPFNLVPAFAADWGDLYSFPGFPGWTSEARAFTWTDNVSKVSGPHTVKFGVFFDYNQAGQQPWVQSMPFIDFVDGGSSFTKNTNNGIANLVLGNYYSVNQGNGIFFGQFRFHQLEMYGQDSWKVNRKLTLDYGLRWAYLGPTYTVKPFLQYYFDPSKYDPTQAVTIDTRSTNVQAGIFNGAICTVNTPANPVGDMEINPCAGLTNYGNPYNGMVQEGNGIPPGYVDHKFLNFEPRLGFAYDPGGNGKTAIRGGVGIFHERIRQNVNNFDGLGNPPLVSQPTIYNGSIDTLSPSLASQGALLPSATRTQDKKGSIPVLYSWSFGVQRELPWKMALDAAYVGNQGRHLQYMVDLNQFPVGYTTSSTTVVPPNSTWLAAAPYKGYTSVNYTDFGANSQYNALQVRLQRRFSKSLTLSADYTYSKNIDLSDNDDNFTPVRDRFHPKIDYGPSGWDRPHVFNLNYVYDLPEFKNKNAFLRYVAGGWETSGVIRAWSGTPLTVTCGGNSGTASGGVGSSAGNYCDLAPGVNPYAVGHKSLDPQDANGDYSLTQWLNPLAFLQPQQGTIGNTGRNQFRGPGYQNWNLSLFKNFNIKENLRLQLRLETFNTWNHVQYGGDSSGVSTYFGTTAAGQPVSLNTVSNGQLVAGTVGDSGKLTTARDPRQIQLGAKFHF